MPCITSPWRQMSHQLCPRDCHCSSHPRVRRPARRATSFWEAILSTSRVFLGAQRTPSPTAHGASAGPATFALASRFLRPPRHHPRYLHRRYRHPHHRSHPLHHHARPTCRSARRGTSIWAAMLSTSRASLGAKKISPSTANGASAGHATFASNFRCTPPHRHHLRQHCRLLNNRGTTARPHSMLLCLTNGKAKT